MDSIVDSLFSVFATLGKIYKSIFCFIYICLLYFILQILNNSLTVK